MKNVVFTLLVVAVAYSTGDKIIGGYECPAHSQPWQVYLTDKYYSCGGSLIKKRWVVSAAHCNFVGQLVVHLGKHNVRENESTEQLINAEKVIRHPRYNDDIYDNDIMLIKLRKPAIFNEYVKPIPLTKRCPSVREQCLVSGWGKTGDHTASVLQCLNLPVLSSAQCKGAHGTQITDNMFCAGFMEGGKDSCKGDSGGPVVCNGKLKGIVSWGYGCAEPGWPGVYTEMCRYIDWIKDITSNN